MAIGYTQNPPPHFAVLFFIQWQVVSDTLDSDMLWSDSHVQVTGTTDLIPVGVAIILGKYRVVIVGNLAGDIPGKRCYPIPV